MSAELPRWSDLIGSCPPLPGPAPDVTDTGVRDHYLSDIRTNYWGIGSHTMADYEAAYDRWMAAHDAEVRAEALRMAAKWAESRHDIGWEGHVLMTARYPDNGRQIAEALRASADELGQP